MITRREKVSKYFTALTLVVFISLFYVTNAQSHFASELSFIEHSILGKDAGSVIPASCESTPSTNHFAGDCVTNVNMGFGVPATVQASFIGLRLTINLNHLVEGGSGVITWAPVGATSCTASGAWSGAKSPAGGTYTVSNPYGMRTSQHEEIYTLTCSNGTKSITKSVRFFLDATSDPCGGGCGA